MEHLDYIISGVTLSAVSVVGLLGNLLLFLLITKQVRRDQESPSTADFVQAVHRTFHNLLMLLSIFDLVNTASHNIHLPLTVLQIYLVSSFLLFGLSVFYPESEVITVHLPYYFLPLAHIGMVTL